MVKRLAAVVCTATMLFVFSIAGQMAGPQAPPQQGQPASQSGTAPATAPASPERALLNQYCVGCHNQRAKAAGQEAARKLTLDDLDVARVGDHREAWETVVRKLRAGMMPPSGARRPEKATYNG